MHSWSAVSCLFFNHLQEGRSGFTTLGDSRSRGHRFHRFVRTLDLDCHQSSCPKRVPLGYSIHLAHCVESINPRLIRVERQDCSKQRRTFSYRLSWMKLRDEWMNEWMISTDQSGAFIDEIVDAIRTRMTLEKDKWHVIWIWILVLSTVGCKCAGEG